MQKIIIAAVVCLVVGLVVGYVVGRKTLERQWSQPLVSISPAEEKASGGGDANPTPPAGTRVLRPMPIGRSRAALHAMTEKDPVVATVGSVGSDDEGVELHVTLENRGPCTVTSLSGVAYGFDAWGRPAPVNKGGESFVAFTLGAPLLPGTKAVATQKLKHVEAATLALAHVDRTKCADGAAWARQ